MQYTDIFLKLLPFTYSKNNETFVGISGMEGSDWIITGAVILMLGIFLYQLFQMKLKTGKKDKDRLDNLLSNIEDSDISSMDSRIKDSDDKNTKSAWGNFKKGLIDKDDETRRVYDADFFFNKSSLIDRFGSNSFASIPALLLSLGLLGTFIGLFYGLVQLNLDNADTLKESMRTLIHASGAKFASSIWGLGLSITFSSLAREHEKNLENKIHLIQDKFNEIYPLQLSEQSLVNHEKSNQSIIRMLTSHLPYLAYLEKLEKLDKLNKLDELYGFNHRIQDIQETLQNQRDAIQGLALDIAESLQETLANSILNAMSEALKNLESHIGGTADDTLHHRITQMSGGIGDEFTNQLKEIINSINEQIADNIGKDTSNLKSAIEYLNLTLNSFKANLSNQNTQMGSLIKNLEERVDAQSKSANSTTQAIAENASRAGSQITEALSPINKSVNSIATLNQQLINMLDNVTSFNQSTENLKNTAVDTKQASANLSLNVQGLNESQKSLSSTMLAFSVDLSDSNKKLNELPIKLSELIDKSKGITTNTQSTYQSLASSYQELIGRNEDSIKKLENSLTNYQELTNSNISDALERIDTGLKKNMNQYLQNINDYQESANNNIQKTLSTFDGRLGEFAQTLAAAVDELSNAIDGLNDRLNRNI